MKLKILAFATLLATTNIAVPALAENIEHTRQLLSTKQCQQCDLSGAGLVLADLSGAQLSGADLSRANLARANLRGANLKGANLSGASLFGVNLIGADLTGANLTGADMRESYLQNANLTSTQLSSAYVQGALGIPQSAGTAEEFYKWALLEDQAGNDLGAIDHYNMALSINPKFAAAYLGRGMAFYQLRDEAKATQDAKVASQLFLAQGDTAGYQTSQNFLKGIELANQPHKEGGSSFLGILQSIGSLLLQFIK